MKKRLVRLVTPLLAVIAIVAFASNAQSADSTVDWHGSTDPGKIVWRHVKNGGKRYKYELPAERYTHMAETDTIKMMYSPPGDGRYLANSHNRCDGWFRVAPGQAGMWTLAVGYDDYIAVAFDGRWLLKNSKVDVARKCSWTATEGLHRFTLVFGDTGGTYGNKGKTRIPYAVSVSVNGGDWLPFEDMVKAAGESKNEESRTKKGEPRKETGRSAATKPPSAEVQEALDMFSADDGLTAAEKIPALKAFIEAHPNEPGVEKLVALSKKLAKEAGMETTRVVSAKPPSAVADAQKSVPPTAPMDEETKALLERLKQPPPTEAEMEREMAKLPPLPPLPVPKIKIERNAISGALINSATARSAIINVREQMRLFIGEMDEEDEKKFDEKWAAALDFPCPEVNDWLKSVSPLLDELVKLKAELERSYAEYEDALAEANILRMNRLWMASHEAMRQVQCVAGYMKAVKTRMNELASALSALGPMPDAAKCKAERIAARKAAKQAVTECFRPEVNTKIGGWYEIEGKVVYCRFPGRGEKVNAMKGADDLEWRIVAATNQIGMASSVWSREKLYIRPLVKFSGSGLVVVYVNEDDKWSNLNADFNGLETEDGGIDIYKGGTRVSLRPFVDADGESRLLIQQVSCAKDGSGSSCTAVYRPVGGADLEMLPGATKEELVSFEKMKNDVDVERSAKENVELWKKRKWTEDQKRQMVEAYGADWAEGGAQRKLVENLSKIRTDPLKEAVEAFGKNLPKSSVRAMPKAKDVYYVLAGMEPIEVSNKPQTGVVFTRYDETDSYCGDTRSKLERETRTSWDVKETIESVVQLAMFRCDMKSIGEIFCVNEKTGAKQALDHATSEVHLKWTPPSTIVKAEDAALTMPLWHEVSVNPFKHAKFGQTASVRFGSYTPYKYQVGPEKKETLTGRLADNGWGSAKPEETIEFYVENLAGGEMGIRYKYRRMVLTEEEAQRIAQETNGKFKDMMRSEWESQNFADAERAVDEYAARLAAAEEETSDKLDRIAFIKENMKWEQENMKRLKEQMAQERELAKQYVAERKAAYKDAEGMQAEIAKLDSKMEDERQDYWYNMLTLSPGKAGESDKRYWEAKSQKNSLEVQFETAREKADKAAGKANDKAVGAAERYAQLEFQYIAAQSNLSHEQDLLRAEETGVFRHTPSAFDYMCHQQLLDSARREVERDLEAKRVRDQVRGQIQKLAEQEEARKRGTLLRLAKYHDEKAALGTYEAAIKHYGSMPPPNEDSIEEWRAFGRAIGKVNAGRAENAQAKTIDDMITTEENLRRAEIAKTGSTVVLCMGAIGAGTPEAAAAMHNVLLTKFVADGYIEGGVSGAALGYVRFHSLAVDFVVGGVEGYQSGGYAGLAAHCGMALAFHVGMPLLANSKYLKMDMKKIPGELKSDIASGAAKLKNMLKFTPKAGAQAKSKTELELEYDKFMEDGQEAVSDFIRKVNNIHALNEKTMTNEQIKQLRGELVKATARVNEHPGAKMILKMDPAYKKVGERFNEEVGRIYKATESLYYKDMFAQGFSFTKIKQFRNASSKGTVGMDADFGIADESVPIRFEGRRATLHEYQQVGQPALERAYKKACGGDFKKAWGQLTTSKVAEGYQNLDWLTKTGTQDQMRELLNGMSLSGAEQAMDVTYFKAAEMMNSKDFPKLVMTREACRGTVKDMDTKFFKALDVRIADLKALKAKKGASFSKGEERELTRLTGAREYYTGVRDTLDSVAQGKLPPGQYEDAIRARTGDKDLLDTIADMRDLMKSLVF
ncbi:MAG: hypothetical protein J6V72_16795 [Kiritimatiellae bacterium]|nr:hypothetical protein [Kiritimatiellia bacterium]